MTKGSPVEDVAKAIAETVRERGLHVHFSRKDPSIIHIKESSRDIRAFCVLWCKDASQAKRLFAMMQQAPKPARGVFDAMGIDPVDLLDRFPSIRGKA